MSPRNYTAAEPINLRERPVSSGRLFTCGRPGRGTTGTRRKPVPAATVLAWVAGLPSAPVLHVVSLLGWKSDGYSEFAYYPFRSEKEQDERPTFQEWLDVNGGRAIVVHESPTVDKLPLPAETVEAVATCIKNLLAGAKAVVVMDSAGSQRTAAMCTALGVAPGGR